MKDKIRILLEIIGIWIFCICSILFIIIGNGYDNYSIYWIYAGIFAACTISISIMFVEWAFMD